MGQVKKNVLASQEDLKQLHQSAKKLTTSSNHTVTVSLSELRRLQDEVNSLKRNVDTLKKNNTHEVFLEAAQLKEGNYSFLHKK